MRFKQFKPDPIVESLITEVSMSPSALRKWAESPVAQGMRMGIEFEMLVPPSIMDDEPPEMELDFIKDDRVIGIEEMLDFFDSTVSSETKEKLKSKLIDDYEKWAKSSALHYIEVKSDELDDAILNLLTIRYDRSQALDSARKKLGKNASQDDIDHLADEIEDDAISEIMDGKDSDEYLKAEQDARENMEEELILSYSERRWFNEEFSVYWMSDAADRFNLEWPYHRPVQQGVSIYTVAKKWESVIGSIVHASSEYHGTKNSRAQGEWAIEPDSSVYNNDNLEDAGLEFISPAEPIAKTLASMEKLWNWARENNCYTSNKTGLHMNISVPNLSIENLDYIKLALFIGDEYVLSQFGRLGNEYCKSATEIIKNSATLTNPDNVNSLLEKMRSHMNTAASKLIHSGLTDKYTSINTRGRYVEFRGPGNDYLNMTVDTLVNTSLRLAMGLQIACDENAYRKEYTKKLYKLIAPGDSNNDVVNIFSRYAAGELDKSTLVYLLKQKQKHSLPQRIEINKYLELVSKHGIQLKIVPDEYKTEEVCLAAVRQFGLALAYVPDKLKTRDLCRTAVIQEGTSLKFVPQRFVDLNMCYMAVSENGMALYYVPERLKEVSVCQRAVEQDRNAIEFVPYTQIANGLIQYS